MRTTDNDHAAESRMHTGRYARRAAAGDRSWIHYGLNPQPELPQFVFLGEFKDNRVRKDGPDHPRPGPRWGAAVVDPANPQAVAARAKDITLEQQRRSSRSSTS
jgi:hypothetical protein